MSNKQKKSKLQSRRDAVRARREKQRLKSLADAGRLANGVELPDGAIAADLSEQAPNNSYSPPLYYIDREFTCEDCGAEEVWTAQQQKWYYEVAKGTIYSTAVRCRACREAVRLKQARQRKQMEEANRRRAGGRS